MSVLPVQNPNHLPTLAYTAFCDFQGDLKHPMTPAALTKMRNSLMKHGVFVPKFVWFDADGNANILDGHQTKQGLASLEADGWEIPPIPYVTVTAASREDAAEKLLQINSAYATINPQTTWLDTFDFPDVAVMLEDIEIPELRLDSHALPFYGAAMDHTVFQQNEPVFRPELMPTTSQSNISAKNMEQAQHKLDTQYTKQRKQVQVFCPNCGENFFINAEDLL